MSALQRRNLMLVAIWPFIILLAGVLIWVLASNAILKEIGKWMFIVGLFWTVQVLSQKTVKVGQAPPAPAKIWKAVA
jgi:hypothetical protein